MPRIGITRSGEQRGICPACYAQVVDVCGNCTIHSDCLSIGANRFCPNQLNGSVSQESRPAIRVLLARLSRCRNVLPEIGRSAACAVRGQT